MSSVGDLSLPKSIDEDAIKNSFQLKYKVYCKQKILKVKA